jgi:arginase
MGTGTGGVSIFAVPYDSGYRALRMGAGPTHFLFNGMEEQLATASHGARSEVLEASDPFRAEVATAFGLFGLVAERVGETAASGNFPLVLSGNCNATVGVVWFDGHADFNTPETTTSGFLDDMGLAIVVGHCWAGMRRSVPAFRPVREENIILVGSRGASPVEKERLRKSGANVVEERSVRECGGLEALGIALDAVVGRVRRVHVHLDLDVLDPEVVGPANEFALEGGISAEEAEACVKAIRERFEIASATVASYDPFFDQEGRVLGAGIAFARLASS